MPALRVETIGYGAGTRDLEDRPNLLRLLVGESLDGDEGRRGESDEVWILETNLDDVPGEWIGYCTESLLQAGALDVFTSAIQMKKNRPGVLLGVICHKVHVGNLERIIFTETGSLGIRRWPAQRHILRREPHTVETPWGAVAGKLSHVGEGRSWFSPEFESCRQVAVTSGHSLREVYRAAQQAFDLSPNCSK